MINVTVVNARPVNTFHAHFCEIFPVLGRFLHSKNPVKYNRRFGLNHNPAHFRPDTRATHPNLSLTINNLRAFTLWKGAFETIAS